MLKLVMKNGEKTLLWLGLSEANIDHLRRGEPIMLKVEDIPQATPPDVVALFAGESESEMLAQLLESGVLDSRTAVETPDQGAPFEHLAEFIGVMDGELDRFLRENPDDGIDYIKTAKERWEAAFETYGLSVHNPMALYTMLAGLDMLQTNVFQAEEQAQAGGEGPDHLDVLKVLHFVIHNGMILAALKRDL